MAAGYGTPGSKSTYPAYEPEASAANPSSVARAAGRVRARAGAGGTNSGKAGSR